MMKKEQTFGKFVREKREQHGLTLQALVSRTGVDMTTISRIENEHSQVMLTTAVHIMKGLKATPKELVFAMQGRENLPGLDQVKEEDYGKNVLTSKDVKAFLKFIDHEPLRGRDFLATWLPSPNHVNRTRYEINPTAEIMHLALWKINLDEFELKKLLATWLLIGTAAYKLNLDYPHSIDGKTILGVYRHGGAQIPTDIVMYIDRMYAEAINTQKFDHHLESVLGRVKMGSVERVKLVDVLLIDKVLSQEGEILGMYWRLSEFIDTLTYYWEIMNWEIIGPSKFEEENNKIASLLITTSRWLQHQEWGNTSWLDELRRICWKYY